MKKLTQKVKDEADAKWLFRAKDMQEARYWWHNCGKRACSFCHYFGAWIANLFAHCGDCVLHDRNFVCCREWSEVKKRVKMQSVDKFNAACKAVQTRICNLKAK